MALPTSYKVGTISVSANGTIVTGVGTNWLAGGIRAGDIFAAKGLTASIETTRVCRMDPLLLAVAEARGFTEDTLDALFGLT